MKKIRIYYLQDTTNLFLSIVSVYLHNRCSKNNYYFVSMYCYQWIIRYSNLLEVQFKICISWKYKRLDDYVQK